MKVYEIFTSSNNLPSYIKNTILAYDKYNIQNEFDKNTECLLYGYTIHKYIVKQFMNERSNIFIYKTNHMTRKEYEDMENKLPEYRLKKIKYKNIRHKIKIISNNFEKNMVDTNWADFIFPPDTFSYIYPEITKTLKSKYYDNLLILGLNTIITVIDSFDYYNLPGYTEVEYDEYMPSKIHSIEKIEPYYEISLDIRMKRLNIFIRIFGFSLINKKKKTRK